MKSVQEKEQVKILASYFAVFGGIFLSFFYSLEGYIVLSVSVVWCLYALKVSQFPESKKCLKGILLSILLLVCLKALGVFFVYQTEDYNSSLLLSLFSDQDKAAGILAFLGITFIFSGKFLPLLTLFYGLKTWKSNL
ncbi:hypothetical protein [Photobacterium sp. R1]